MNTTNRELLKQYKEKESIKENMPFLAFINASKIREWENNNHIRVQTLYDKINKIEEAHFVLEGEGKDRRIKTFIPESTDASEKPQRPQPVFKEGKTKEMYDNEYELLMEAETKII